MENSFPRSDITKLLSLHNIDVKRLDHIRNGNNSPMFRINNRFLIRLSRAPLDGEIQKLLRVKSIPNAPGLKHAGSFDTQDGTYFYMITDFIAGEDLIEAGINLSIQQQYALGEEIAKFLAKLHSIEGRCFDIGHYIPTIPHHEGSWREGHQAYHDFLQSHINKVRLKRSNRKTIKAALAFIRANTDSLESQKGPKLLHNDFHPKNMIVQNGVLSGIIDWECSQFGEVDFEFSHILHWCIFPPDKSIDLSYFLDSLLGHSLLRAEIPDLSTRLTIYEIEHEIHQLIWNNGNGEDERCQRTTAWLDGRIDLILKSLA